MKNYNRVYAQVDLDAIAHNMEALRANLPNGTRVMGVVKADGYGHGSVPVALAIAPYVEGYGVATAEEAIQLRRHGIKGMVLVMGPVHEDWYEEMARLKIRPTLFQYEKAKRLSDLALSMGKRVPVHIGVDTGMSRIGLEPGQVSADLVARMSQLPGIWLEGMFTHFARADEADKSGAKSQLARFLAFRSMVLERGVSIPFFHCANSAAIIDMPEAGLDMVRAGISIYGLYPSSEVGRQAVALTPAMELKSRITYLKKIGPGTEVSYGGTFRSDREMVVATIPIGYGDGYPRSLSGKGQVLVRGSRAPILGRICMDQLMVDVSHIPKVEEDDLVTLIGRDGEDQILAEELAGLCGGFHYEILCHIGKRVPRVYVKGGRVVGEKDYFEDAYPIMVEKGD